MGGGTSPMTVPGCRDLGPGGPVPSPASARRRSRAVRPPGCAGRIGVPECNTSSPFPGEKPGAILAGWAMIQFFDTAAARQALARRKLPCPDCGQALKPWGRARERTIRDLGGALLTVRPTGRCCVGLPRSRTSCSMPGCCRAAPIGRADRAGPRQGRPRTGHRRIAGDLGVPAGTVRGWLRGARRSAVELRVTAIRVIVASGHDVPARWPPGELGFALENLGAAASITAAGPGAARQAVGAGQRPDGGKLLNMSPAC